MPYEIIVAKKAKKDFKKLDRKMLKRIDRDILNLADNPFPAGYKRLISFGTARYRIRVGDYRVLYNVDTKNKLIYISSKSGTEKKFTGEIFLFCFQQFLIVLAN